MTAPVQTLHLLCAGAAKGLVLELEPAFRRATGCALEARFGAVGAMRAALLAGAPCDVLVLTGPMIEALHETGAVGATVAALGRVGTGIAARVRDDAPAIGTAASLRAALLGAVAIHVPDLQASTAGIHVARMLATLGIAEAVVSRLHVHPNGAVAMQSLARHGDEGALGCTQITEILYTTGVRLVGALPAPFDLRTTYAAAVGAGARATDAAQRFVVLLTGAAAAAARQRAGFEAASDWQCAGVPR